MHSSRIETRSTNHFRAKGSDGQIYRVIEYTDFHESRSLQSLGTSWIAGLKSFRLDTGDVVNENSPTEYTVVASGMKLTRI